MYDFDTPRPFGSWLRSFSRLFGKNRRKSVRESTRGQVLRFETLELRSLLSVTLLPTITGTVFQSSDGGGEQGIAGVPVTLYLDNGSGQFSASDQVVTTVQTNPSGEYQFPNVPAGTYWVQQSSPAPGLARITAPAEVTVNNSSDMQGAFGTVIDSFDKMGQLITVSRAGKTTESASAAVSDAIGGERDLNAQLSSPSGSLSLDVNYDTPGVFEASYSGQATGSYQVIWDGAANETQVTNPTGLNHVDLTDGGLSPGIGMTIGADHDTAFTLLIYTDATHWSFANITVPADSGNSGAADDNVLVPFTSFQPGTAAPSGTAPSGSLPCAGPASFSNVGAVELESTGGPSVQTEITQVGSLEPVQVPGPDFANTADADLAIFKSASAGSVYAGNSLTYTLTASNLGPADATGVTMSDSLPAGETYVSSSESNVTETGGTVTVKVGPLNDGAASTATFVVMVSPNYTQGTTPKTIINTASVSGNEYDPNTLNNIVSLTTTVTAEADLAIFKSASAGSVYAGNSLTYTLTASNLGPSDATGVTMSDSLPNGETYVSSSSTNVTEAGGTVTVNVGPLNEGTSATATFVVMVSPSFTQGTAQKTITNAASIVGNEFDPYMGNNSVTLTTTVTAEADLAISKSAWPIQAFAGSPLTYTLTASNLGPSDATGVIMSDTLPAGETYVSTSSTNVTEAGGTVTVKVGPLNDGAASTAAFVVMVSPSFTSGTTPKTITNGASVSGNEYDPNLLNNSTSVNTTVTAEADLAIFKSASASSVYAGNSLTYILTASNLGPSDATGVTMSDTLPAGETYVSTSSTNVTQTGGTVTVNVGPLNEGAASTATFVVMVSPSFTSGTTSKTITNGASIVGNEYDPYMLNNSASVNTTVSALDDLSIQKSASAASVKIGAYLTYTLTASNSGPSDATGVVISDSLPAGLTYDSSSQGSLANGTLTVNVGDLAAKATDTVTIVVTVTSGTTSFTNWAYVRGNEPETSYLNNSANVTTFIINQYQPPTPPPFSKWYFIL